MTKNYQLPWNKFDWDDFQQLCILIAEYKFPKCDFQEYLKQGNKQHGTDLISFDYENGSCLNVQCKREKKLTASGLEKIVEEFISGKLAENTSDFILAVSIDTNTPLLIDMIFQIKENLLNNHNIKFHCWGKSDLEKYLKSNWGIVLSYFGQSAAEEFCYPQLKNSSLNDLEEIKNYIPRKIFKVSNSENPWGDWCSERGELEDLLEILLDNRIVSKKICLIGDAYQGKSSYLRQVAFQLMNHSQRLHPLILNVKDVVVAPLEEILNANFGKWKSIPLKDMIIFIDGLDEAPTERFREMIKHIKTFAKGTPSSNIVLSCRKQFYAALGVSEDLEEFEIFELSNIQEEEINYYLESSLNSKRLDFISLVEESKAIDFLTHPFYLVNLVEEYKFSNTIPNSKIGIIELFIKKSFQASLIRPIQGGRLINDQSHQFKSVIVRFALALQFAGVNSFKYDDVQKIFKTDDVLLLQHNSMIQVSGNSWSFSNAMFQEHFAALLLSKLPFEKIEEYVTVGNRFKKIRSKWLQTMFSLLSILDKQDILYNNVFDLIKKDSIELLFEAEPSKFEPGFIENLLKEFIEKCISTNARPITISETKIGEFISGNTKAVSYLIKCLGREEVSDHIKDVCIHILKSVQHLHRFKYEIHDTVIKEIKNTNNAYYAGQLIRLLIIITCGDEDLLNELIKLFPENHEFRDNIYRLILLLNLQDKFYDYALSGVQFLVNYNRHIHHFGSSQSMEDLLISSNLRKNFWKLFRKMQDLEWEKYYNQRTNAAKDFTSKLFDRCTEFFETDNLIVFPIIYYIESLGSRYSRPEFKEIDKFLDKTHSHTIIVRHLIPIINEKYSWQVGTFMTPELVDYLLFEYEEKNLSVSTLKNCLNGIFYKDEVFYDEFSKVCDDVTGGKIFDKTHCGVPDEFMKLEIIKRVNDKKYITSLNDFQKGITNYFKAYGKKTIPYEDHYVNADDKLERKNFDSNFIFRLLILLRRNGANVSLKDCLKWIEDKNNFEDFRAEQIMDYSFENEDDKIFYLTILEGYYSKNLSLAKFGNLSLNEDRRIYWKTLENRLGDIFQKFEFKTPEEYLIEMVWLDESGIRAYHENNSNGLVPLSGTILNKLSHIGVEKLKEKIISNIQKGINIQSILGTHLALCRHLRLKNAVDEILKIIKNIREYNLYLGDVVDIYLELGGDINGVVEIIVKLDNYNEYWYFHLIKIISPNYPLEAIQSLNNALTFHETKDPVKVETACHLADLGDFSGFKFLTDHIRTNEKSPYRIQGRLKVHNIETSLGLKELADLMYLVIDKKYEENIHFSESAKNILLELLYGFASKSESDLEMVIEFCENSRNHLLEKRYANALNFNFYINNMVENFRNSDKAEKEILEIKRIVQNIEY